MSVRLIPNIRNAKRKENREASKKNMKTHWQNIGDIFAEPSLLFTRLTLAPCWGIAYLLVCLLSIFVACGRVPYEEQLLSQSGQPIDIVGFRIGLVITHTIIKCVSLLIEALFMGAILTAGARIFNISEAVKFQSIFAILIHLFLIRVFGDIINTGLIFIFRDVPDVTEAVDLQLLPGMHQLLFFIEDAKLIFLLSHFHIVALWEMVCLTIAIETIAKVPLLRAVIVSVCIWCISVLIALMFLLSSAA